MSVCVGVGCNHPSHDHTLSEPAKQEVIVPDTSIPNSELTLEQQIQLKALQRFFVNNQQRILQWQEAHTPYTVKDGVVTLGKCTAPIPIAWNTDLQEYVWLNRKVRRS